MIPQTPPSLTELRQIRPPLKNVNVEHHQQLSSLERLALWITQHVGTMGFFLIIFTWTVLWLSWNAFGPITSRFDPFPAFVLWLFISNMIQIFLMPLIMIGQNLQSRHAEHRAESDYQLNVRSEREVEAILMHLENLNAQVDQLQQKIHTNE